MLRSPGWFPSITRIASTSVTHGAGRTTTGKRGAREAVFRCIPQTAAESVRTLPNLSILDRSSYHPRLWWAVASVELSRPSPFPDIRPGVQNQGPCNPYGKLAELSLFSLQSEIIEGIRLFVPDYRAMTDL
jgi:hypothetical protein